MSSEIKKAIAIASAIALSQSNNYDIVNPYSGLPEMTLYDPFKKQGKRSKVLSKKQIKAKQASKRANKTRKTHRK